MVRFAVFLAVTLLPFALRAVDLTRAPSAPNPSQPPRPSVSDPYRHPSPPTAPFRLARTLSVPTPRLYSHPRFQRLAGRLGAARYIRVQRPADRDAIAGALARQPDVLPRLISFYRRDALRRQTSAAMLLAAHARDVERPLLADIDRASHDAGGGARATAAERRSLVARHANGPRARDLGARLQTALERLEKSTLALWHLTGASERQTMGARFRRKTLALKDGVHVVLGLMGLRGGGDGEEVIQLIRRRIERSHQDTAGRGRTGRRNRTPRLYDPPMATAEERAGETGTRATSGEEV